MSAICAQIRLGECQQQLILPSLVCVFNIFIYLLIYLLKRVKSVIGRLIYDFVKLSS